jgi:hypothetical protein
MAARTHGSRRAQERAPHHEGNHLPRPKDLVLTSRACAASRRMATPTPSRPSGLAESNLLSRGLYLEWTRRRSSRRFPLWGHQFTIRAVRTAAHQCRVTAPGRAGSNAPNATGLIPSSPTGRRAGFRASCSRQSNVARGAVLNGSDPRPIACESKTASARGAG